MKPRVFSVCALALALAAMAGGYFAGGYGEASRREAFVLRCNEQGEGGMFTSREYCEALYARSRGRAR
jgi:hypothetical protein